MHASQPDHDAVAIRTTVSSQSIRQVSTAPTTRRYQQRALAGYQGQSARLVAAQAIVGFGWTAAALIVGFAAKMLWVRLVNRIRGRGIAISSHYDYDDDSLFETFLGERPDWSGEPPEAPRRA